MFSNIDILQSKNKFSNISLKLYNKNIKVNIDEISNNYKLIMVILNNLENMLFDLNKYKNNNINTDNIEFILNQQIYNIKETIIDLYNQLNTTNFNFKNKFDEIKKNSNLILNSKEIDKNCCCNLI